ncbi:type II toxin-antitoxin system RelE/ParE family toxin [Ferruginivarius sediminum]|uniref:Type II toxin-antitoxin system RelE/ParE family toxin n=1 Tax=Ferruginivarius sediminum TaxID=2661937 RepID=A0A369T834_9PROT|nr:type II toxin-antitoxin system RelE/ParE family toxin [Ferruginivarius sediminum]RDD61052.1 type II toxin-antitoxin system RelE/ParE family toxin [Ferruginivarius sediminum]
MIKSFRDPEAEKIYAGKASRKMPSQIQRQARRKLRMLAAAVELQDLSSPPGNRLEKLSGDRAGQHSIRINNQWRICFKWNDGAEAVEVVDYHR